MWKIKIIQRNWKNRNEWTDKSIWTALIIIWNSAIIGRNPRRRGKSAQGIDKRTWIKRVKSLIQAK